MIATCAATSRELASVADRPNHLYLLDAMGLAISVGTGIAQAIKNTPRHPRRGHRRRRIPVDEPPARQSPPATSPPENLVIILLDNGVYASTASIPTQAVTIDLGRFAESVDLKVLRAENTEELSLALKQTLTEDGPWFIHTRTEPGNEPDTKLLLIDPVTHGNRFQNWLTPTTHRVKVATINLLPGPSGPGSAHLLKARELQWK